MFATLTSRRLPFRRLVVALTIAPLGLLWLAPTTLSAQDDVRQKTSLQFVPADVGFYSASLQLRRQVEALVNSKAIARLMSFPIVQLGVSQVKSRWQNPEEPPLQMAKALLEQPENKQLAELLLDVVSNEVFVYGNSDFAELLALANRFNGMARKAQFEALAAGREPNEALLNSLAGELLAVVDTLRVPDLVIGFRLTDTQRATQQLARLEAVVGPLIAQQPGWEGRLRRENVAGRQFLQLTLDGRLIPWDQLLAEIPDNRKADAEKLAEKIKTKTATVSLGVYESYLLLSIGDDNQHLASLGKGPLLVDRSEMAPLKKLGDKPYTAIAFVDGAFLREMNSVERQLDDVVSVVEQALPQSPLDKALQQEIVTDVRSLRQQLTRLIPRAGSVSSFAWLSNRGMEGFAYQWEGGALLAGDRRLSILDHAGGALGFAGTRGKASPESWQLFEKLYERSMYYANRVAVPQLSDTERQMYERVRKELEPMVQRLGAVFRDKIIPALADGQSAVVLDAQTTSKKWHEQMPEASQPLPMLEIALLIGVSDEALLRQGARESFSLVQEIMKKLHTLFPEQVPEFQIPPVQERTFPGGVVYYHPLPRELGLDAQVAPNAGLNKEVLVLSFIPKQTARLLGKSTPRSDGPLARASGPLAGASYFNFAGLVEATKPWVEYGITLAAAQEGNAQQVVAFKEPIMAALELLQCVRGVSQVTYSEGPAAITHFEWHIQDLQ